MNRLADSSSPYLLQHAGNPVDWNPWGGEAFARARERDVPILVSVGYSSCHWCHVMEHESFSDPATAALMNDLFVNVKVDREERPDVDALTMETCVTMTGQGGWPTTVFLTPYGRPFYAGTYYPPEPRHGLPAFRQILQAIAETWRERRDDLEAQAERLVGSLGGAARLEAADDELTRDLLDTAERGLARDYEPAFGGFGTAPKFPPSSAIELLLRRGGPEALGMVRRTLDGMAAGGLYDVVGGGFHRYSVDARWLVPHFEKMLYDNALLTSAYLHAWVVTGEERYRAVVEETVGYLLREMLLESGGFASAQDADTDGVEGLTYTWTPTEWEGLGLDGSLLEPFEHGRAHRPRRARHGDEGAAARRSGRTAAAVPGRQGDRLVERARARGPRRGRPSARPRRLASRRPRRSVRSSSVRCAATTDVSSGASATAGSAAEGFLDDHANVAHGLVELHVATGDVRWLLEARRIVRRRDRALRRRRARRLLPRSERRGGARRAIEGPRRRPDAVRELDDGLAPRAPRANLGRRRPRSLAGTASCGCWRPAMERVPRAFSWALCALDLHLSPPREVAIVGGVRSDVARAALAGFSPETVVAVGPSEDVPLLAGKGLVDGQPAVYVCERFSCRAPVTRPDELTVPARG